MRTSRGYLFAVVVLGLASQSMAANRVFVSGSGMDTGACPISAPCRSFAYALTQVAAPGEVIALDTAGYGTVTISQSVSIIASPGVTAFIAASSGDAVLVAAGQLGSVTLRGLALTSNGATNGVNYQGGTFLNIENCVINGFSTGVLFTRILDSTNPTLQVINTILRNNVIGLSAADAGPGTVVSPPTNLCYVTIARCFLTGNGFAGLYAEDNSRVAVSDTMFASNQNAVYALASGDFSLSEVSLDRCTISRNFVGVIAGDAAATAQLHGRVRVANCMITGNDTGVSTASDGATLSRIANTAYTNTLEGNTIDGSFSGTYSAK